MSSLAWFIILVAVLEIVTLADSIRSKTPKKLLIKEFINLNFILLGTVGIAVGLVSVLAASTCLVTVVSNNYWSGFSLDSMVIITIARYIFPIIMLWAILTGVVLFCRAAGKPNFLCIWSYTKEETEYHEKKKAAAKEKWPKWLRTFDSKMTATSNWQPGFIKRYTQKKKSEKKV